MAYLFERQDGCFGVAIGSRFDESPIDARDALRRIGRALKERVGGDEGNRLASKLSRFMVAQAINPDAVLAPECAASMARVPGILEDAGMDWLNTDGVECVSSVGSRGLRLTPKPTEKATLNLRCSSEDVSGLWDDAVRSAPNGSETVLASVWRVRRSGEVPYFFVNGCRRDGYHFQIAHILPGGETRPFATLLDGDTEVANPAYPVGIED